MYEIDIIELLKGIFSESVPQISSVANVYWSALWHHETYGSDCALSHMVSFNKKISVPCWTSDVLQPETFCILYVYNILKLNFICVWFTKSVFFYTSLFPVYQLICQMWVILMINILIRHGGSFLWFKSELKGWARVTLVLGPPVK